MVQRAATAVLGHAPPPFHLALWHGLNLPLLMSLASMAGGVALYFTLQRHYQLHLHQPRGVTWGLRFSRANDGVFHLAGRWIARLDTGSLQRQLAVLLCSALAAVAWAFGSGDAPAPGSGSRVLLPATAPALAAWRPGCCCWAPAWRWCVATTSGCRPWCWWALSGWLPRWSLSACRRPTWP